MQVHQFPSTLLRISRTCSPSYPRFCAFTVSRLKRTITSTPRPHATHRDAVPSSLLSQALDQKQKATRRNDSVGPFTLGMVQPSMGDDVKVKKWSQLSAGGKGESIIHCSYSFNPTRKHCCLLPAVMRTTARTTNFTVILLGAGLTAVLVYALTSELFARNSPTVLYGEACERIKASPKVPVLHIAIASLSYLPCFGVCRRIRSHGTCNHRFLFTTLRQPVRAHAIGIVTSHHSLQSTRSVGNISCSTFTSEEAGMARCPPSQRRNRTSHGPRASSRGCRSLHGMMPSTGLRRNTTTRLSGASVRFTT